CHVTGVQTCALPISGGTIGSSSFVSVLASLDHFSVRPDLPLSLWGAVVAKVRVDVVLVVSPGPGARHVGVKYEAPHLADGGRCSARVVSFRKLALSLVHRQWTANLLKLEQVPEETIPVRVLLREEPVHEPELLIS